MTRINQLSIVFQKPINLEDYGIDPELMEGQGVFATEGQSEVKKFAQVGLDRWVENTLEAVPLDIPVGTAGMTDLIRRVVIRAIANMKSFDKDWKYFYGIATFQRPDGSTFFRTIIPRTAIGIQFRNLRRGVKRHR